MRQYLVFYNIEEAQDESTTELILSVQKFDIPPELVSTNTDK